MESNEFRIMSLHFQQDLIYEIIIRPFLLQLFEFSVNLLGFCALERVFLLLSEKVILQFRPVYLFCFFRVLSGIDTLFISL